MLRKMRWRFIGSAMSAFFVVILILLCFINLWNYQTITQGQDNMLDRLLVVESERPGIPGAMPPGGASDRFSPEVQYMIRFFSVEFDDNENVVRVNQDFIASVSKNDAVSFARTAIEHGKERGYQKGYRYIVHHLDNRTYVIFLNSERELETINSILLITATIASACIAVVFVLVLLFSRRAILPYMRNIETQKQFITNASHELKTPLTAISTSVDVLALEHSDNEWICNIQEQTLRMSKLISNLVTLSRLDEETPFPKKNEFSLSDAIWEAAEPFKSITMAKGKEYSQDIEGGIMLLGDQTAIQQMISILLDNALKYSIEGGTISLSLHRRGKKAEIIMSNTCNVNDMPDISRLFDRFYRGDSSHSTPIGGTGIGLSIAKATVDAHGGQIYAKYSGNSIIFHIIL